MPYRILWDNGANACGEFPWTFPTPEAAAEYGQDWADEMNAMEDIGPDEDGYTFEIIAVEPSGE